MDSISDMTILIIASEEDALELTIQHLREAGYRILTTRKLQEGIKFLEIERVNLLLTDVCILDQKDFQLVGTTHSINPEIAVVVMTGPNDIQKAIRFLNQGADSLLLKPFSEDELAQSINKALKIKQNEKDSQRLLVLRPLFDITENLFSENDPERLKDLILKVTSTVLDCDYTGLIRLEEDTYRIIAENGKSLEQNFIALFKQVTVIKEPVLLNNYESQILGLDADFNQHELGSVACVSNKQSDDFMILMAGRGLGKKEFNIMDSEILDLLSKLASIALENAGLYTRFQEHVLQIEKSQQALIQAEKMAAVGRLTASIAHEINNPLQSVQNCLHMIKYGNLSEESLNNYISLVAGEVNRLAKTAKRMLDFYRPSALDRKAEDINKLVKDAFELLVTQLRQAEIEVTTVFSEGLPFVMVVGNQIQQAVLNIGLNAIEAMPEGGRLSIMTSLIDNQVIIRIEDTGLGVSDMEKEKIFEPLMSTKEDRLGLGLTVSYGIVTAHGGTFDLVPTSGKGTRFVISLPAGGQL